MAATVIPRVDKRVHARLPQWWQGAFTDYWIVATGDETTASGATNLSGLDSYGWTTTSVVFTNTVTADFMSAADDTPPNYNSDASADLIRSPIFFGSYADVLVTSKILGYVPTKLVAEFYGAFSTASANESATNMGFHNGSAIAMGIYSDGTNFQLSNGVTTLAGALIDNLYHTWKISVDSGTNLATWFIDGVQQGTTLAVTQDVWPACFNAVASTTNRWNLAWAHCWYE